MAEQKWDDGKKSFESEEENLEENVCAHIHSQSLYWTKTSNNSKISNNNNNK